MRLSEAIRLGSLTFGELAAGSGGRCALNCGLAAIGRSDSWYFASSQWPWIEEHHFHPNTSVKNYKYAIALLFDSDVISGEMTLEALCDQVRAWEDELAAKGINVEQVTMAATPETTHEPAAEHTESPVTRR